MKLTEDILNFKLRLKGGDLTMKKLGACLIGLFLVVGSSLIMGPGQATSNDKVTCSEDQFLVPIDNREFTCVDNVKITGTL